MLPGLGFSEIVVLAVLALLVVGPKDLPLMLRKLGQFTRKLQAMAHEFRAGFDELARQAELDELRKEVDALRKANPLTAIQEEAEAIRQDAMRPIDPDPAAQAPEPWETEPTILPPDDGGAAANPAEAVVEEPKPIETPIPDEKDRVAARS
jgi:sec-independent protein translocase protein TatB